MIEQTRRFVSNLWAGILDIVYPPHCLVCKKFGDLYLCRNCVEQIPIIKPPYCRVCGINVGPTEHICGECRKREYKFECARCASVYDGVLRQAIHALKYEFHIVMADPLAEIMIRAFPNTYLARRVDLVVPVPIHITKLVDRGFNQSEELAWRLCAAVGLPLANDILVKRRKTKPQVDLPEDLRFANVEGTFSVAQPERIVGKRVLVIDDVFTTGATLSEAAKTLRAAGASSVCAYALARSVY
ncbi:MAG: ComF family protein [Armatimonadetes bacterium]|nr:ComF family protein [Armatimonadota bacterium]